MDLTKIVGIFEREFAISYLMPTLVFAVQLHLIGLTFGVRLIPGTNGSLTDSLAATTFVLAAIVFSIVLMMFNPLIMRLLQGYVGKKTLDRAALSRRFVDDYNKRFRATVEFQEVVDLARKTGADIPAFPDGHAENLRKAVLTYPDKTSHFLPFRIGNFLRAAEIYPRAVYGLDAVGSWQRLQHIIPDEMRDAIAAARSQLFFASNVFVLTLAALAILLGLMVDQSGYALLPLVLQTLSCLPLLVGVVLILIASRELIFIAGGSYGTVFAAAYDLHRGELAEQLGLKMPRNTDAERKMWTEVNRVFLYRSPHAWDRLTSYRKKD